MIKKVSSDEYFNYNTSSTSIANTPPTHQHLSNGRPGSAGRQAEVPVPPAPDSLPRPSFQGRQKVLSSPARPAKGRPHAPTQPHVTGPKARPERRFPLRGGTGSLERDSRTDTRDARPRGGTPPVGGRGARGSAPDRRGRGARQPAGSPHLTHVPLLRPLTALAAASPLTSSGIPPPVAAEKRVEASSRRHAGAAG